jgi:hypothetical protein
MTNIQKCLACFLNYIATNKVILVSKRILILISLVNWTTFASILNKLFLKLSVKRGSKRGVVGCEVAPSSYPMKWY